MEHTHTDCRTDNGITVGLIDAIITNARVLKNRLGKPSKEVISALHDLSTDSDFNELIKISDKAKKKYYSDLRKEQSTWNEYPDM